MPGFRALCLSLLLSAALAADEITVEHEDDAVIVRSPVSEANFLFRAPGGFEKTDAPEGFAIALALPGKGAIRLRLGEVSAGQARRGMDALVKEKESEYLAGYGKELAVSGKENRRIATTRGEAGTRHVLVLVDGPRLYELFLEASEPRLAGSLRDAADGFTILEPKAAPAMRTVPLGDLKAAPIEHEYYRIQLLKPDGFSRQDVDPDADPGIFLHLRREDEQHNRTDIFVRVFLKKALKESADDMAQARIDKFRQKYPSAKGAKKPKRTSFRAAENAYKFKLAGKLAKSGIVVEEEWRFIDHSNGRVYEIQMTNYGGAARFWKKDLQKFWKSIKIRQ